MLEFIVKKIDKDSPKIERVICGKWYDLGCSKLKSVNGIKLFEIENMDNFTEEFYKKTRLFPKYVPIGSNSIYYKKGDILQLCLGTSIELPEGYQVSVNLKSSTFKNYGLILTDNQDVIDSSYKSEWVITVYCTRDGSISYNDNFLQFKIQKTNN